MTILLVDSTSDNMLVAVWKDGQIFDGSQFNLKTKHSQNMCLAVESTLKKAEIAISDVDVFACAVGPGSFTGIRIGVATVKGYQSVLKRKLVSVCNLEAICNSNGCAVIDAGNGWYFAEYENGVQKQAPCLVDYDCEKADNAEKFDKNANYVQNELNIVLRKIRNGEFDKTLVPVYVRKSQAELSRK